MRAAMLIQPASFHSTAAAATACPPAIGSAPVTSSSLLRRSRSVIGFVQIRSAVHLEASTKGPTPTSPVPPPLLRRARSESDLVVPGRIRWAPPPALAAEEEEIAGGGAGKGKKSGGGGQGGGEKNEKGRRGMGSYYQQMLESDPENPLLLRNYGSFLHQVEGDVKGAEECYGRAILASPGDADVLSLYGKLVWETQRDEERASSYFDRALQASPDDCYVLGSYASLLWDVEEDVDEGEETVLSLSQQQQQQQQLLQVF